MTKPEGNLPNVSGRSERVDGAGMAQNVWGHALCGDGWLRARGRGYMLREDVLESGSRHGVTGGIEEQFLVTMAWAHGEPRLYCRDCLFPQWQHALAPPLSHDVNGGERCLVKPPMRRPTNSETRRPAAKARCSIARSRIPDSVLRFGASRSARNSSGVKYPAPRENQWVLSGTSYRVRCGCERGGVAPS